MCCLNVWSMSGQVNEQAQPFLGHWLDELLQQFEVKQQVLPGFLFIAVEMGRPHGSAVHFLGPIVGPQLVLRHILQRHIKLLTRRKC